MIFDASGFYDTVRIWRKNSSKQRPNYNFFIADADIYDQEILLTVMKINKIFITAQLT